MLHNVVSCISGLCSQICHSLPEENTIASGWPVCVFGCRHARGSVQRCRGAPLISSHAAPSLPLREDGRNEEWEEAGERPPPTLKLATATFHSVHFPPHQVLLLLPPPCPPHLLMAAVVWGYMQICPTVQTRPHALSIIMMIAMLEALTLIT